MQENIERGTFEIEKISQFETEEDPLEKLLRYLNLWLKRSKHFQRKMSEDGIKTLLISEPFRLKALDFKEKCIKIKMKTLRSFLAFVRS